MGNNGSAEVKEKNDFRYEEGCIFCEKITKEAKYVAEKPEHSDCYSEGCIFCEKITKKDSKKDK